VKSWLRFDLVARRQALEKILNHALRLDEALLEDV